MIADTVVIVLDPEALLAVQGVGDAIGVGVFVLFCGLLLGGFHS